MIPFRGYCLLLLLIYLSACSSTGEVIHKPAPLQKLDKPVRIDRLWNVGAGVPDNRRLQTIAPFVYNKRIYTVDTRGEINIVSTDGNKLASKTVPYQTSSIAVNQQLAVVTTIDGVVLAYNPEDLSLKWQYPLEAEVLNKALLLDDKVIVRSLEGKITALSAFDGRFLWAYQQATPVLSNRGYSDLVYYDHRIIAAFDNGFLASINPVDGKPFWEKQFSFVQGQTELDRINDIDSKLWVEKGYVYLIGFDGYLSKINLLTAQRAWKDKVNAWSGVVANDTLLFLTDKNSEIVALSKDTGIEVWRQKALQYRKLTVPLVYQDYLLVGDDFGYLHLLQADTGKLAGRTLIDEYGINAAPVANSGIIYVLSLGSYLTAVKVN